MTKSFKTGGKGKKNKGNISPKLLTRRKTRNPRRILWEELVKLSNQDAPWIVGGDFNVILHLMKTKVETSKEMGPMEDFNDMMTDTGLIDAGFEGEPFTWTNKKNLEKT
ncbi:UNVERIFIED_CONTAM: hypothetical protein Sradi_7130000 [Sesamum radiatum]|uniref:Uncharacterized protein n=1 Tax=Sesamum radiatum TaxID=300843 RepID=A0AAW2IYS4_SESRA